MGLVLKKLKLKHRVVKTSDITSNLKTKKKKTMLNVCRNKICSLYQLYNKNITYSSD